MGRFLREHRVLLLILALCAFTRLWRIERMAVIHDESMFMSWARAIEADFGRFAFLSQRDGKPPLFYWISSAWPGLETDPLVACRQVSAVAGMAALVAVYLLAQRLFDRRTALLAALFYVFCPFMLFHERMALVDALLSCFGAWALYGAVAAADGGLPWKAGAAIALAATALGYLTKPPALMWVVSLAAILAWAWRGTLHPLRRRATIWAACAAGAAIGIHVCLSSDFPGKVYAQRDRVFVHRPFRDTLFWFTPEQLLAMPWEIWGRNLLRLGRFLLCYLPWTLLAPLAVAAWKGGRSARTAWIWFGFPTAVTFVFLHDPHSRFILFAVPPLVVLAARGSAFLADRWGLRFASPAGAAFLLLSCAPGALFAYRLGTDPERASWAREDEVDYVTGELAGNGLATAVEWLRREAENGPYDLFVYHRWGVPTDVCEAYFRGHPKVRVWMVHWGDNVLYKDPAKGEFHPPSLLIVNQHSGEVSGPLDFSKVERAFLVIRSDYVSEDRLRALNPGAERAAVFGKTLDGLDKYVIWKLR